tara:strand:+ start:3043 stop:3447 length:405 start_codon:yes stop_codon:yes gene_type:complete
MNSANLKILRGEVRPRADLSMNNPIAYNGHRAKFSTIPNSKASLPKRIAVNRLNGINIFLKSIGSIALSKGSSAWTNPPNAPNRTGTLQENIDYWKGQKIHIAQLSELYKRLNQQLYTPTKNEGRNVFVTGDTP